MADEKSHVRVPTTIEEYRRLGHAFLAGSKHPAKDCVWVVASTWPPFHRVQQVCATEAEAEAILAAPVDPRLGWSDAEAERRVIYKVCHEKPKDATATYQRQALDEIDPTGHGMTEPADLPIIAGVSDDGRIFADVASVELRVNWTDGTSTTYGSVVTPDAIFITRGAFEMFALPAYGAAYGVAYIDALREVKYGETVNRPSKPRR
jgi:hypothetical protein